jgi:phosphatidate cytidylyltransferase
VSDPQTNAIALRLVPVLAALLAIGAALVLLACLRTGPLNRTRLWTAYATEFGILAAILLPAYAGTRVLLLAFLVIAPLATRELFATLRPIGAAPWTALGVGVGAASLVVAALAGERALYAFVFAAVVPIVLGVGTLRRPAGSGNVKSTAATLFGVVYPNVLLAHVLLLERLDGGFGYVVLLFGLIEVNDSFALLVGTLVGGPRLWPRVSPNKTLVGSIAGFAATLGASRLLGFATPTLDAVALLGAGLLVAVLGQVGDLVASSIKRGAGVKDFGRLVPAQGGMLDIYDALIFTAPAFYGYIHLVVPALGSTA